MGCITRREPRDAVDPQRVHSAIYEFATHKPEIDALLAAPDRTTEQGRRDHSVLLFLYNSGARASEAAAVAIRDLDVRSDGSGSVRLVGKGGKTRHCPLWSTTMTSLRALTSGRSPDEPVFLVGSDAFAEMGAWRAPEELFALAHYAVMLRPPQRTGTLASWLPDAVRGDFELAADLCSGRHRRAGTWLRLVEIAGFDVSASAVRERLRDGRSVRYLLPDTVREAVLASSAFGRSGG